MVGQIRKCSVLTFLTEGKLDNLQHNNEQELKMFISVEREKPKSQRCKK